MMSRNELAEDVDRIEQTRFIPQTPFQIYRGRRSKFKLQRKESRSNLSSESIEGNIDLEILPLITAINRNSDMVTAASCQGHIRYKEAGEFFAKTRLTQSELMTKWLIETPYISIAIKFSKRKREIEKIVDHIKRNWTLQNSNSSCDEYAVKEGELMDIFTTLSESNEVITQIAKFCYLELFGIGKDFAEWVIEFVNPSKVLYFNLNVLSQFITMGWGSDSFDELFLKERAKDIHAELLSTQMKWKKNILKVTELCEGRFLK